ncbi:MAG TPA: ATP synthase F1 subunit epsilon [Candidatus Paceibacterota bacterium]|nr:ATP synthase F1 subunit epsilon [Candidatus Paceibacterota bacterium]
MMSGLRLKIVTPERVAYEEEVSEVTLPTATGQISILAGHEPLVSLLKPGELVVHKNDEAVYMAVSTGLIEMRKDGELVILADTAEHAEELELERIEEAKQRAEEILKERHDRQDVDFARAQAALERELARVKVARRRRGK